LRLEWEKIAEIFSSVSIAVGKNTPGLCYAQATGFTLEAFSVSLDPVMKKTATLPPKF
jgi:hypothetical protein